MPRIKIMNEFIYCSIIHFSFQELTGIYRINYDTSLNRSNGFPVFATVIEANYITKQDDKLAVTSLTDEDIKAIIELSKDEKIGEKVMLILIPQNNDHQFSIIISPSFMQKDYIYCQ